MADTIFNFQLTKQEADLLDEEIEKEKDKIVPEYEPFDKLNEEYGQPGSNPEIREPHHSYDRERMECPLCGCCPIDPVMCGARLGGDVESLQKYNDWGDPLCCKQVYCFACREDYTRQG